MMKKRNEVNISLSEGIAEQFRTKHITKEQFEVVRKAAEDLGIDVLKEHFEKGHDLSQWNVTFSCTWSDAWSGAPLRVLVVGDWVLRDSVAESKEPSAVPRARYNL